MDMWNNSLKQIWLDFNNKMQQAAVQFQLKCMQQLAQVMPQRGPSQPLLPELAEPSREELIQAQELKLQNARISIKFWESVLTAPHTTVEDKEQLGRTIENMKETLVEDEATLARLKGGC